MDPSHSVPAARPHRRRLLAAGALAAVFALGAGTGLALHPRSPAFVAPAPGPIATMHDGDAVAIKGQVADLFGKDFVLQDGSGRALVDTGPAGDGGGLVGKDETVTVAGRFDRGIVHAAAIQHADGRTDAVGPPGPPPPPGLAGWFRRHDPRG